MKTFWHGLIRYEGQKVNPRVALRNALGIGIPLAAGVALGQPTGGLLACIGALDVAYSDGSDPYQFRARRMLSASLLVALAIFAGGLAGGSLAARIAASTLCAFAAGMMVAVGTLATDIGNITLVTLIVFSAHSMAVREAALSALAALGGALFQTGLTLMWWPLNRYVPERRALAALFGELARVAVTAKDQIAPAVESPVASAQSTDAQTSLAGLGGHGSLEAARYLMLLSQAERIRLSLLAVTRMRIRFSRQSAAEQVASIDRTMQEAAAILQAVARSVESGDRLAGDALAGASTLQLSPAPALPEVDALRGQLRAVAELAAHATPAGLEEFARREATQPWTLRLTGALASLRANLTLQSGAFRHAVRLAMVVPAADLIASAAGWQRGYWAAMTAAIVLRPDFGATFTRSLLRVAGTLAGLGIATALFHFLTPSPGWQVVLLTCTAFLLRCFGPANYGLFAIALTSLVVLLLAATGLPPGQVILARAVNTVGGGALALLAYWLWPTWERSLVTDVMADLLDAYRHYFRKIGEGYLSSPDARELDRARLGARLARSRLEGSLARLRAEPRTGAADLARLDSVVANSLRFVHAVMALEAGLYRSRPVQARPPFRKFMEDVDLTLYELAAFLRGSAPPAAHLPDLRADHRALIEAGWPGVERHALVDVETDRITNSLNTLAKEILEWKEQPAKPESLLGRIRQR